MKKFFIFGVLFISSVANAIVVARPIIVARPVPARAIVSPKPAVSKPPMHTETQQPAIHPTPIIIPPSSSCRDKKEKTSC